MFMGMPIKKELFARLSDVFVECENLFSFARVLPCVWAWRRVNKCQVSHYICSFLVTCKLPLLDYGNMAVCRDLLQLSILLPHHSSASFFFLDVEQQFDLISNRINEMKLMGERT